jgi:myo-inositol-1(or 4)-monophosphatase
MGSLPKHDWQADLALILDAARQAGEVAMKYFRKDPKVWWKNGGQSPVSEADYAANKVLEDLLRKARPSYGWLSEETEDDQARLSHDTLFIIDPIDGTRAYLAGKDTWCVSVAVVHQGRPVAGTIVAPVFEEDYTVIAGEPAYKNGTVLQLSESEPQRFSLSVTQEISKVLSADILARSDIAPHVPSLAYRLAMVGDGRLDATLVRPNSNDWDLAAADLIIERAGGKLCHVDGSPLIYNRQSVEHPFLCAASNSVLPAVINALQMKTSG